MASISLGALMAVWMFSMGPAWARRDHPMYLSGGVHYAIEDIRLEGMDLDDGKDELYVLDYDNSWGMNLRAGYSWHENIVVEGQFQYTFAFSWVDRLYEIEEAVNGHTLTGWVDGSMDLSTLDFIMNVQVTSPLLRRPKVRPYVVVGAGYTRIQIKGGVGSGIRLNGQVIPEYEDSYEKIQGSTTHDFLVRAGAGGEALIGVHWGLLGEFAANVPLDHWEDLRFYTLGLHTFYRF